MISQRQFFVISATFLWIQLVSSSVELTKIDDRNDIRVAKKLVKYLDSKINVIPKIEIKSNKEDEVLNEGTKEQKSNKPAFNHKNADANGDLKKIVIKRIVPHGLQVPKFYRDLKYNTLYKPLFRVHKGRNQNPMINGKNMKNLENNIKVSYIPISPNANDAKQPKSHFHNDKHLLHPFIHNLKWHQMKSKQSYKDARNYLNFLLKYFNLNAEDIEEFLRSPNLGKSGEEEVPAVSLAPATPSTTTKKPKWLPRYPAWNYWTYEKHIYQDACPGLQINVGGICTWIPPH